MSRDDIIRMARGCGITLPAGPFPELGSFALPDLLQLVRVAVEAEREACAQVCVADESRHSLDMADDYLGQQAERFASTIRARSTP